MNYVMELYMENNEEVIKIWIKGFEHSEDDHKRIASRISEMMRLHEALVCNVEPKEGSQDSKFVVRLDAFIESKIQKTAEDKHPMPQDLYVNKEDLFS